MINRFFVEKVTQAQVDSAISAAVTGLFDDRGNYDASVNTFPASGGSGDAGAVLKGDIWTVSVAGTLGGVEVKQGDIVRALVDAPGQTTSNWALTNNADTGENNDITALLNLGYFDLSETTSNTPDANKLRFRAIDQNGQTLFVVTDADGFDRRIGRDSLRIARNTSGAEILKGKLVYITGSTGQTPNVSKAIANSRATAQTIALAAKNVADNGFGLWLRNGEISGIDTSTWTEGTVLYLSDTVAGEMTSTRPTAPNFAIKVGIVTNSHANQGRIDVDIEAVELGFGTSNQFRKMNAGGTDEEYKTLQSSDVTDFNNSVNALINTAVTGLFDDRGNYDASVNTFPATGGSGAAGAILKGDIWTVTVAGTLGGDTVNRGDTVRALVDAPGQTATNWAIAEANQPYTEVTSAQRRAIVSPHKGRKVYDTELERFMTWNGEIWTGWGINRVINKSGIDQTNNNWHWFVWDNATSFGVQRTTTVGNDDISGVLVDGNVADGVMTTCNLGNAKGLCTGNIAVGNWLQTSATAGAAENAGGAFNGTSAKAQEARTGGGTSVLRLSFQPNEIF